ncbi:MAG: HAMP domain-containing sensor histidine kinase [Sphingomonadaceae bacterium]
MQPVGLFAAGGLAVAAWRGGLYATFALALLMAAWISALMFLSREQHAKDEAAGLRIGHEREDSALMRTVLDEVPTALLSYGTDMQFRALNRAARRLFGVEHIVANAPEELKENEERISWRGRSYRVDRIEGSSRTVIALIDVESEERMAEARATRELLDVLSHEVMNAMTPIASLAESALSTLDDVPTDTLLLRQVLETLERRTSGLMAFTEAYRELARLPEPCFAPMDLNLVLADIVRMFEVHWRGKVTLLCPPITDLYVVADRDQLAQALWALIQNAAQASLGHSAEPSVSLTVRSSDKVIIEIADNGPGIPPKLRESVFRPFFTTKAQGSGIGLSLAQQILLGHGGTLRIVSSGGSGAVFQARLSSAAPSHYKL